jgi:hypothetical protein
MGSIVCLHCAQVLMEIEPRQDTKAKGYVPPPVCMIEEDDQNAFLRCPRCHAKNIVIEVRTPSGYPQLAVVGCSIR